MAEPVLRREMRERWRRPLTFLQLALWALALALAGYKFYQGLVPPDGFAEKSGLAGTGRALFYAVGRAQMLAWIPVGMLLAAPALAVERERGHLPEWLLAGLRPEGIARAKFRALAGFVAVMACLPFPILTLCFPLGGISPEEFGALALLTVALALASAAVGLRVSAQSDTVAQASASALSLGVGTLLWGGVIIFVATLLGPAAMLLLTLFLCWLSHDCARAAALEWSDELENIGPHHDNAWFVALTDIIAVPFQLTPTSPNNAETARGRAARLSQLPAQFYTPLETWLLCRADFNPIAHRELVRHFRARYEDWVGEPLWALPLARMTAFWLGLGALILTLNWWVEGTNWFKLASAAIVAAMMIHATLASAPGLARERALRTLADLQMTALSTREITVGKAGAALLACAHRHGGPSLAICVLALSYGPLSALAFIPFCASCATLSATATLMISARNRKTEIVTASALLGLVATWVAVPWIFGSGYFGIQAPTLLQMLWLAPLHDWASATTDIGLASALVRLTLVCGAASLCAGGLCACFLHRARVSR